MRVHFIAIGGAVMHNLAITLHLKGYKVTGSDDEIFEPSRTRLEKYGLLPESRGWHPELLSGEIDTVILGMHARGDNPELARAKELGLKILSFPEYLYGETAGKKRIVVAGSHGKTTTTAMIMHALKTAGVKFDYMVGSAIDGYESMVGLSDEAGIAVFEGDEYLSSAVERRPKFHFYKPDIAIINGIAWDHMNVFPTFDNYLEQFRIFVSTITPGGYLVYFEGDENVRKIAEGAPVNINKIPYRSLGFKQDENGFHALAGSRMVPLQVFGEHNMQNMSAAREACLAAGLTDEQFFGAMPGFAGTSRRLQKIAESDRSIVYLDFAHAPSKVKATVDAVAARFPDRELIAVLELHTFSSLNSDFLPQYSGTLDRAGKAFIYFNPHAVEMKKLKPLSRSDIAGYFGVDVNRVYDDSRKLFNDIGLIAARKNVYLLMSSGDFDGMDLTGLAGELV
ncbi:MAG: Mur ligase family protein [Bacteroidales bacterium]